MTMHGQKPSWTRRDFLRASALAGTALALPGCASRGPLRAEVWPPLEDNRFAFAGLATSLPTEHDYLARVEGRLPPELRGVLYRNGPGLYERNGLRKRMILDGDGMIQAFAFVDGRVRYRNRFVRTEKFVAEEAAGRFLYPTWGTPAPGGFLNNIARQPANQASVTVVRRGGSLYAFDEYADPYELDANTLDTVGSTALGAPQLPRGYKAHWKLDGRNGDWLHFGMNYGRKNYLYVVNFKADGGIDNLPPIEIPWRIYIHDWVVSERYLLFILHPAVIPLSGVLKMLFGFGTVGDMIRWQPELGNLLLVLPRSGGTEPLFLGTDAAWMWHALNACDRGGELVADFVGSPQAIGLGSPDAPLFRMMEGEDPGPVPADYLPVLRRYVIDPVGRTVRTEVIADDAHYEMPFVNPRWACHPHRFGYCARGPKQEWFWHGVSRIDTQTGAVSSCDFGESQFCSEPVFVPRPGHSYAPGSGSEPGWILTLVYDAHSKRSYLAVLEAEDLPGGPVARIHLRHHAPLSFHGYWHPES